MLCCIVHLSDDESRPYRTCRRPFYRWLSTSCGTVEISQSDNGRNFVGANNEMKTCLKQLNQVKIKKYMCGKNITWIFKLPASPWMGGVWEFLIKPMKKTLKAIIKDRISTKDCLYTFLCEVATRRYRYTSDTRRSKWLLGRILETYQGANDVVRTVKLKNWNGEMNRPASKKALLEAVVE